MLFQERNEAAELFSGEEGTALAHTLASTTTTKTFDPESEEARLVMKKRKHQAAKGPSLEEQKRIREAIKNAKTLEEIASLEQQLEGGVIPGR